MKISYTLSSILFILSLATQACSSASQKEASSGDATAQNRSIEEPNAGSVEKSKALPTKGCILGDCDNGKGTFVFDGGAKYAGPFQDGLPEGDGVMNYPNGDVYTGPFKQGKRSGYGTYVFKNGDKYVGEFLDGEMKGLGNYYWTDGTVLKGEFKENGNIGGGTYIDPKSSRRDKDKACKINDRKVICPN